MRADYQTFLATDFNGDGLGDLAMVLQTSAAGAPVPGACLYVLAGGAGGLAAARSAWFDDTRVGASPTLSAGDVDGDGYADLLYTVALGSPARRHGAITFRGSPAGLVDDRTAVINPTDPTEDFYGVYGAGDFNLDGYHDIIMNARSTGDGGWTLDAFLLYEGSAAGLPAAPTRRLVYPWTPYMPP